MTIKSKIFNHGDEHESDWPSRYPQSSRGFVGYWDRDSQSFKEGYPPNPNNIFGVAPIVIFDAMPSTYHEGAGRSVESRSEWDRLDKETGSLTFSSIDEPNRHIARRTKEEATALKADRRRASEEAIKMVRANPREINQKLQKEAEKQAKEAKKIADNYGLHKELKGII